MQDLSITAAAIPKEQEIFNRAWKLLKEYYRIQNRGCDQEWAALVDEARKLGQVKTDADTERKKGSLACDLALAVLEHLEAVSKHRE